MSLITDESLQTLWTDAQNDITKVWPSVALWNNLWNKHIFWEDQWNITREASRVSRSGRIRVITTIKIYPKGKLVAIGFHEAGDPDQDIHDVEGQAAKVCREYLARSENAELRFVYVVTSLGTAGKVWRFDRGLGRLITLSGGSADLEPYVELHSQEATQLRAAFYSIREKAVI